MSTDKFFHSNERAPCDLGLLLRDLPAGCAASPAVELPTMRTVAQLRSDILDQVNSINIARMDAQVLTNVIVGLLQEFEIRECDAANIDALYCFGRLLDASIGRIKLANSEIEELAHTSEGTA